MQRAYPYPGSSIGGKLAPSPAVPPGSATCRLLGQENPQITHQGRPVSQASSPGLDPVAWGSYIELTPPQGLCSHLSCARRLFLQFAPSGHVGLSSAVTSSGRPPLTTTAEV